MWLTCSAAFGSFFKIAFPVALSLAASAAAKGVCPFLSLKVRSSLGWDNKISEQRGCLVDIATCSGVRPSKSCYY